MNSSLDAAEFYFERGRYREAIGAAQECIDALQDRTAAYYLIGISALQLDDYDLVRDCAGSILSDDPNQPEGHDLLAYCHWEDNNLDVAEQHLREGIRLAPDFAPRYAGLAQLIGQKGRLEDALTVATQGLQIAPNNLTLLITLQHLYRRNKQPRLTERMEQRAQAIDPEVAENHLEAGFRLLANGKIQTAKVRLREAMRLNPGEPGNMERIAFNTVSSHFLFRHGFLARVDSEILIGAALVPVFWYVLSLLWAPLIWVLYLSVAIIGSALAHRALFAASRWYVLRRLRSGRL